jgi:hypothetical protein
MLLSLSTSSRNLAQLLPGDEWVGLSPGCHAWFAGYLMHEQDGRKVFLENREAAAVLAERMGGRATVETVSREMDRIIGGGSLVVIEEREGGVKVMLATDRGSTFPLYHALKGGMLTIGDCAIEVAQSIGAGVNLSAAISIGSVEMIPGRETLAEGVDELKPGEVMTFTTANIGWKQESRFYWRFRMAEGDAPSEQELEKELAGALNAAADDWAEALLNSHADGVFGLPLSGGLDSRLMVGLFAHRLGKRATAVSYGDPAAVDVRIAGRVTSHYGAPFRQLPFLNADFLSREKRLLLSRKIGLTTRLTLADGGLALASHFGAFEPHGDRDIVGFLPGHSGDTFTGSKLVLRVANYRTAEEVADHLLHCYHVSFPAETMAELLQPAYRDFAGATRDRMLKSCRDTNESRPEQVLQRWMMDELLRRRAMPELRLYTIYSRPRLPLYDPRVLDVLTRAPIRSFYEQRLYRNTIARHIFVGAQKPLAEVPLQGRGLLKPAGEGETAVPNRSIPVRAGYRMLRILAPVTYERQFSSCPMMGLWKQNRRLREEVWQELENNVVLREFFDQRKLMEYLRRRLGKDYGLTTLGLWGLLTVELAARQMREKKSG